MKLAVLFAAAAATIFAAGSAAYRTVYILPMSNALDQYLAIQLTTRDVVQVVADPQKADAILTDHIGAGFEKKLDEIYGPKPKTEDQDADFRGTSSLESRGKGTVFLVDRKTRAVVWTTYVHEKGTSSDAMNDVAKKIADKLAKDSKVK
ncbi:MAG: hypothetical protein ACRD30_02160 [Bryobacteraceae bacterium]